jgi:1,4-alpha-glucan branching enzyme
MGNGGCIKAEPIPFQGQQASARVTLPPLSVVVFKPE